MKRYQNVKSAVMLLLAICVCASGIALAGTTGKISGVVTDLDTGEPIAFATVIVEGTNLATVTDEAGRYVMLNVPVGKYTLKASLVGYEQEADAEMLLFQEIEVRNLKVSVDLNTEQNLSLRSKPVELGTVVVVAERPLLLQDRTASLRIVEADEILARPTRGYQELVALQPGVVQRYGALMNIRGGRTSEVGYFVDGFSQQDPLTGNSTTQINNNDLEEVSIVTGGFNAEYGLVASGAINVTTKDGGESFGGTFEAVTDNFHGNSYDYNVYDASFSGPFAGLGSFYVSGERRYARDGEPHIAAGGPLPANGKEGWTWRAKLNMDLHPSMALKLSGLWSEDNWDFYLRSFHFNAEHMPRLEDHNQAFHAKFQHTVNPHTFYTLAGSYFNTERERGDGKHFDDIWAYGRPGQFRQLDDTRLFRSWDDIDGPTAVEDTVIDGRTYVLRGDEGATWNDYLHRQSSYVGFDFDVISQVHPFHEVRAGIDYQRHTLRRYYHLSPSNVYLGTTGDQHGFRDVDRYGYSLTGEAFEDDGLQGAKHPVTFAAFAKDKIEVDGLVVDVGLRLDYLNVNTQRLRDPESPLDPDHFLDLPTPTDEQREAANRLDESDLEPSQEEISLSPRVGIAFPLSAQSVFHVSYGKYLQRPDLMDLYVSYDFLEYMITNHPYFYPIGNPNLRPEKTTAYEIGWTRQIGNHSTFDITAYYKDVDDLVEVSNQQAKPFPFSTYRNADFGTIKGLEVMLRRRRHNHIGGQLSYTLAHATGTGSFSTSQANIAWLNAEPPKTAGSLDFDQRHKLTMIVDLFNGRGQGPVLNGWRPLERTSLNFTFNLASGFPYTPVAVHDAASLTSKSPELTGPVNSQYGPWTHQLDMKAAKGFGLAGVEMEMYFWVVNVFNRKNVEFVWAGTGLPNTNGYLSTDEGQEFIEGWNESHDSSDLTGQQKYELRENDPTNYGPPRQIRAGLRLMF